jgi:exopolysaccharide biosynthesis predicted pyruvyltransferase EpsI
MLSIDDPFVRYLRERRGAQVYLPPYWGNSGDALIRMGDEILLKELGLVEVVDPKKASLILWPGGNPTMWEVHIDGWKRCFQNWPAAEFVIAPATLQGSAFGWQTVLQNAPKGFSAVFARDPESHANLSKAGLRSNVVVGLAHDPAFHLRDSDWIKAHREANASEYVLASFRADHEASSAKSTGLALPPVIRNRLKRRKLRQSLERRLEFIRNLTGGQRIEVCDASSMDFHSFVDCVGRASQVHTDRLHCMILAVLLGKEVFGYPTSFGKLEAVYEHSIKDWAKVKFVKDNKAKGLSLA